jgi:hypothetical protein
MSNKGGRVVGHWQANQYRSGSWIEDHRCNADRREGNAEGVGSVPKVAQHTSIPLSLPTLDNTTSRPYQGSPPTIKRHVTASPLSSNALQAAMNLLPSPGSLAE